MKRLAIVVAVFWFAAASTAMAGQGLDRFSRWLGIGYGPGYHAAEECPPGGCCQKCGAHGGCPCRYPWIPRIPPQYLCGGAYAHRYPLVSPYYVGPGATYVDYGVSDNPAVVSEEVIEAPKPISEAEPTFAP